MATVIGLLGAMVLVAVAMQAAGRDLHVNNLTGDDRATGEHPQTMPDRTGPVRTIAKALRLAQTADRVVLTNTGQPYRESISLFGSRHSGTPVERFTLEGNGTVLDGSAPVPPEAWHQYRGEVYRFHPLYCEYQQLFLGDRPVPRVYGSRLSETPPSLEPKQWCLHNGYLYFRAEHGKRPQDYPLAFAEKQVGITLFHVDRVRIANLTVQGFQLDGIGAFNSARTVTIIGVTCRGNGRAGIAVGGASLVEVEKCLVGNNGAAQLLTESWSETHVDHSELLSNTAPAWVDNGGRVYLDGKPASGGLDDRKLEAANRAAPPR